MDKRDKQVKQRLVNSMISLSKMKDWHQITITDLIKHSGVARASFYRNFESIEQLMDYGVAQIRSEYWKNAPSANRFLDLNLLIYTFKFYGNYADLILAFQDTHMQVNFLSTITESMMISFGDMPFSSIERYSLYYYAGALYNMTICWLKDGQKETPQQFAEMFLKLSS